MHPRIQPIRNLSRSRGVTLIYVAIIMVVMIGLVAMSVDWARIQLTKTETQAAADAAAIYAAGGIVGGTATTVRSRAATAASDNKINGSAATLNTATDVEFGVWDPSTTTFRVLGTGSETAATAIRVTVHTDQSHGTQLPLFFAGVLGFQSKDVTASAIASIGTVTTSNVAALACPWLAGMPTGSTVAATGGNPTAAVAPSNSPIQVSVSGGTSLRFAQASGNTGYLNSGTYGPDGELDWIVTQAATNGINSTSAPIASFVGIFLDNNQPSSTAMAASLDFSTAASRDFQTLSPQLKQVFYIGDGLDSSNRLQTFVAPSGATRLYLGIMDENGWWWDNTGSINFTTVQGNAPVLVK